MLIAREHVKWFKTDLLVIGVGFMSTFEDSFNWFIVHDPPKRGHGRSIIAEVRRWEHGGYYSNLFSACIPSSAQMDNEESLYITGGSHIYNQQEFVWILRNQSSQSNAVWGCYSEYYSRE